MRNKKHQESYSHFVSTLRVIIKLGRWLGVHQDDIRQEVDTAIELADESVPDVAINVEESKTSKMLSELLSFWDRDNRYLDGMGSPIELSSQGSENSLESLFKHTLEAIKMNGEGLDSETCFSELAKVGAITLEEDGKWRRAMDAVPLKGESGVNLAMQLRFMSEHAETIDYNMKQEKLQGLFYMVSHVDGFPKSKMGKLHGKLWSKGSDWIKELDGFMSHERDISFEKDSDEDRVRAGVVLFAIERSE